ncbi:MAG TPA: Gfo/Idh/MocA family oxidoreductase [Trebonia sp.]|nr:Gfo/Idh/MocA family oxidoreductase [Trebonia sp.]
MSARRYAVVGTGARAGLYIRALADRYADEGTIVAWCDQNRARMNYYDEILTAFGRPSPAQYRPADFGGLLDSERPDAVIVTAPDHTHPQYAAQALRAGCDVILEKPVATSADGARLLADAARTSAGTLRVTFNYRYAPRNSVLRRVIADGIIGTVTSVHFEWVLDTVHGADYFRRWHRQKAASGGLLVHKSSHHFDLVNWWLGDIPSTVYARGALRFYGADSARARGLEARQVRSAGAPGLAADPFALDLAADPALRRLYLEAEAEDGYVRDRDVFSPGISIEDNLAVLVGYRSGALLTYSLNAHSPWEGYRVSVNGDAGRAELEVVERGHVRSAADGSVAGRPAVDPMTTVQHNRAEASDLRPVSERLLVQRHWEQARAVPIPAAVGPHAGGDEPLLDSLLKRDSTADPLGQRADYTDGLASVVTGLAANESIATGTVIDVRQFGIELGRAPAARTSRRRR